MNHDHIRDTGGSVRRDRRSGTATVHSGILRHHFNDYSRKSRERLALWGLILVAIILLFAVTLCTWTGRVYGQGGTTPTPTFIPGNGYDVIPITSFEVLSKVPGPIGYCFTSYCTTGQYTYAYAHQTEFYIRVSGLSFTDVQQICINYDLVKGDYSPNFDYFSIAINGGSQSWQGYTADDTYPGTNKWYCYPGPWSSITSIDLDNQASYYTADPWNNYGSQTVYEVRVVHPVVATLTPTPTPTETTTPAPPTATEFSSQWKGTLEIPVCTYTPGASVSPSVTATGSYPTVPVQTIPARTFAVAGLPTVDFKTWTPGAGTPTLPVNTPTPSPTSTVETATPSPTGTVTPPGVCRPVSFGTTGTLAIDVDMPHLSDECSNGQYYPVWPAVYAYLPPVTLLNIQIIPGTWLVWDGVAVCYREFIFHAKIMDINVVDWIGVILAVVFLRLIIAVARWSM